MGVQMCGVGSTPSLSLSIVLSSGQVRDGLWLAWMCFCSPFGAFFRPLLLLLSPFFSVNCFGLSIRFR